MGRFLMTLLLSLALFGGVAWYFDLFKSDETTQQVTPDGKPEPKIEWKAGEALYAPMALPRIELFNDKLLPGDKLGNQILVPDCNLVVFDKQEVSAAKDGLIEFVGKEYDSDD